MSKVLVSNREYAIKLMRHPLNRTFFRGLMGTLEDDTTYGWPDMKEEFTRQEIAEQLKIAEKEEAEKTRVS